MNLDRLRLKSMSNVGSCKNIDSTGSFKAGCCLQKDIALIAYPACLDYVAGELSCGKEAPKFGVTSYVLFDKMSFLVDQC